MLQLTGVCFNRWLLHYASLSVDAAACFVTSCEYYIVVE